MENDDKTRYAACTCFHLHMCMSGFFPSKGLMNMPVNKKVWNTKPVLTWSLRDCVPWKSTTIKRIVPNFGWLKFPTENSLWWRSMFWMVDLDFQGVFHVTSTTWRIIPVIAYTNSLPQDILGSLGLLTVKILQENEPLQSKWSKMTGFHWDEISPKNIKVNQSPYEDWNLNTLRFVSVKMFTLCSSSDKMIGSHRVCFDCFDCFVFLWYFMLIFQGVFHQKNMKINQIMSGWSLQAGDYLLFQRPTSSTSSSPLTRPIGEVPRPEARGVYVWPTVYLVFFLEPTKP